MAKIKIIIVLADLTYKYNYIHIMDYLRWFFTSKQGNKQYQILKYVEDQLKRSSLNGFKEILSYLSSQQVTENICSKKLQIINEEVQLRIRDFISTEMLNIAVQEEFDDKCDFLLGLDGLSMRTISYLTSLKQMYAKVAEGRVQIDSDNQPELERMGDIKHLKKEVGQRMVRQISIEQQSDIKETLRSILQKCKLQSSLQRFREPLLLEQMCRQFSISMHSYLDEVINFKKQQKNGADISAIYLVKNEIVKEVHKLQSSISRQLQFKEMDLKLAKPFDLLKDQFNTKMKGLQQSIQLKISEKNVEMKKLNKEMEKLVIQIKQKQTQWTEKQQKLKSIQNQHLQKQKNEIERLRDEKKQIQSKLLALSKENKRKENERKQLQRKQLENSKSNDLYGAKRQLQSIIANIEELKQIQQNTKEENRKYQIDRNGEMLQKIRQLLGQKFEEKSTEKKGRHNGEDQKINQLQNELLRVKGQVEKEKESKLKLQNKFDILKQENKGLVYNLQAKSEKLKQIEIDLNKIIGEMEQKKNAFEQLSQQIDIVKAQNTELTAIKRNLEEKVRLFQKQVQKLNKKITTKQNQFQILNQQLRNQKSKHQSLIFQRESLKEANRSLVDEVEEVRNQSRIFDPDSRFQYYFPWDILTNQSDSKKFIIEYLQNRYGRQVQRTKPLCKLDPTSTVNFHKYIDGRPYVLALAKLRNGKIVASYSQAAFVKQKDTKKQDCVILSVTNRVAFNVRADAVRSIVYDDYFLIFGNSELRFKSGDNRIFSNLGVQSSYFDNNGHTVDILFGEGKDGRELFLESYQMYEIVYARSGVQNL